MKSAGDQIKFAVRLAQSDVSTWRPGDLLNERDNLRKFVTTRGDQYYGPFLSQPMVPPFPGDYTQEDFNKLQAEVHMILEQVTHEFGSFKSTLLPTLTLTLMSFQGAPLLQMSGSTRDVFLARLFFLLNEEGVENIKICPECSNIFWQDVKWQKYCARRCSNLASVKRFHRRAKKKKGKKKK